MVRSQGRVALSLWVLWFLGLVFKSVLVNMERKAVGTKAESESYPGTLCAATVGNPLVRVISRVSTA